MSYKEVNCEREGCRNSFKVAEGLDERRCNKCGLKHRPPWDNPEIDGPARPARQDDDEEPVLDGSGDRQDKEVSLGTGDGEVHLHIHIHKK